MAQVVKRTSSPPYLLIIFVFLFLIATTMAVLMYLQFDKKAGQVEQLEAKIEPLVDPGELRGELLQEMIERRRMGEDRNSVVGQLKSQIQQLTQHITGVPGTVAEAQAKVDEVTEVTGERSGLVEQVLTLHKQYDQATARISELETKQNQLQTQLDKANEQNAELITNHQQELEKLKTELVAKGDALEAAQKAHEKQVADLRAEWNRLREERDANIAEKTQRIEVLQAEVQRLEIQMAKQRNIIEDLRNPDVQAVDLAGRPDGRVRRVLEDEGICYIDLGRKAGVKPGMTFSVYDEVKGVPESGEGKAKIVVTSVSPSISECRIIERKKSDRDLVEPPLSVEEGDWIGNVVFSPVATYTFVVEGEFDLHGTGQPSAIGAREVKMLIRDLGGKVSSEVTVETDFVVLGQEPARPPKPEQDDPPQVWQTYNDRMKAYDRYRQVQLLAQSMQIQVLNSNRFIALTGLPTDGL